MKKISVVGILMLGLLSGCQRIPNEIVNSQNIEALDRNELGSIVENWFLARDAMYLEYNSHISSQSLSALAIGGATLKELKIELDSSRQVGMTFTKADTDFVIEDNPSEDKVFVSASTYLIYKKDGFQDEMGEGGVYVFSLIRLPNGKPEISNVEKLDYSNHLISKFKSLVKTRQSFIDENTPKQIQ
jgi:hypothetical protein